MRRRAFISLLGGVAAAWPLAAHAQQTGKLPTIGFLGASTPSAWSQWTAAFVQRLRELGWTEGRTVAIEYRWAEGRSERYADIAAEFGIADEVAGKSRKVRGPPSGEPVGAVVARGEAEIGFQQVSELIHVPGITFVGAIPAEVR